MTSSYDPRTPTLLPLLNSLLQRTSLPTIHHPREITPSLLIALYESLIQIRLSIDRRDKSHTTQVRNVKLLLGEMVMGGWDVGAIDPVGVVEREEGSLMDLIEIIIEIGREEYSIIHGESGREVETEVDVVGGERELDTISEDTDDSVLTLRPLHHRAGILLDRIRELNPSLQRPVSPSPSTISRATSTVSRATQTSPPPIIHHIVPPRQRARKTPKRTSKYRPRKLSRGVQTDDDTSSGIPSSIPLSYSSDSSPPIPSPRLSIRQKPRKSNLTHPSKLFPSPFPPSPLRTSRTKSRSSSSEGFRIDSPYTATLRRRRQKAIDSLHQGHSPRTVFAHSSPRHLPRQRQRVRVFSVGRDVADSTFAEDSDESPHPRQSLRTKKLSRQRIMTDPESTTDALTDLERRVNALRIYGAIEEERKGWLLGEIKRKKEGVFDLGGLRGRERSGSGSWSSVGN